MRSLAFCLFALPVLAGGGPETTLVVVNAKSPVSQLIAREYAQLRDIPDNHVLALDGVPGKDVVTIDEFIAHVWTPIDAYLKKSGLEGQIDCIAYSAGFPYAVQFRKRVPGFAKLNKQQRMTIGGQASLNGATYLIQHVLEEKPFWDLAINRYYRPVSLTGRARNHYFRAQAAMRQKRFDIAAKAFQELFRTFPHDANAWYNCACCLAQLKKKKAALDALEEAAKRGFNGAAHAGKDPDLASVRSDPRFATILTLMGKATPAATPIKPIQGFSAARDFAGDRYILSVHLAHTGRYGNSVPEVLAYLRAAKAADGTHPKGTVYFLKNGNVRSTTREPQWAATAAALKARRRPSEVLNGVLPKGKADVIGVVVGSAGFKWAPSKSTLLPGSIAEHLTSFGAHFGTPGQTKISEFLRYGAAGSSGTVMEPLAIANKFPHGLLHAFYADGCSLAEAFYQSVQGPYQLMIVGDPLARPFATFPKVTVDAPAGLWSGPVKLTPRVDAGKARFEYWVDGVRRAEGASATLYTKGAREIRVVAVVDDAIETRAYQKLVKVAEKPVAPPPPLTVKQSRPKRSLPGLGLNGGWVELPADGFHQLEFRGRGRLAMTSAAGVVDVEVKGRWAQGFVTKGTDWWPLTLKWQPKGNSKLEILLGGSQPLAPAPLFSEAPPALKRAPVVDKAFEPLIDQKRDGEGVAIPAEGLVLTWKTAARGVANVVLFP
ncbi:MAG: tetratricopeptide repeat protein, partial [Planctomycetota bacterium]|nr:tetratricopeptide repeat protein [Planctomycetota bacterium]